MWRSILFVACLSLCLPRLVFRSTQWLFPSVIFRGTTEEQIIALTIDDAPYETTGYSMLNILNALHRHRVKATFFVISDLVTNENECVLRQAIRDGHELANHGKTNSIHAFKQTDQILYETRTCLAKLRSIYKQVNVTMKSGLLYYRPGGGIPTPTMVNALRLRYRIVLGSTYPFDPIIRSPQMNFKILKAYTRNGDIVVLHDRMWTEDLLDLYLPWLKKHGYQCILLSELLLNQS